MASELSSIHLKCFLVPATPLWVFLNFLSFFVLQHFIQICICWTSDLDLYEKLQIQMKNWSRWTIFKWNLKDTEFEKYQILLDGKVKQWVQNEGEKILQMKELAAFQRVCPTENGDKQDGRKGLSLSHNMHIKRAAVLL